MSAQTNRVLCLHPGGLHRVAYQSWGDIHNPRVLICVHGLTRVSDDFEKLAQNLSTYYRVVCPDIVGRGRSDRLADPSFYQIPQYVADMVTLLAHLHTEEVHWVGTSMGGLIGIQLAGLQNSPIKRLVLNDVGPSIPLQALQRIGSYVGQDISFASFAEGLAYIKVVSASFGAHSEQEWHKLAADVLRQHADGGWYRHYDLGIALAFKELSPDLVASNTQQLWQSYDAIRCPTLVLRGEQSDILDKETAAAMTQRGPCAECIELAGVGHAPTLLHDDQIQLVSQFLLKQ